MGVEAMKGERPRMASPSLVWVINYWISFWDGMGWNGFGVRIGVLANFPSSASWAPLVSRSHWIRHFSYVLLLVAWTEATVGTVRADDTRLNTDDDVRIARRVKITKIWKTDNFTLQIKNEVP